MKNSISKNNKNSNTKKLIEEFLKKGGKIKVCKPKKVRKTWSDFIRGGRSLNSDKSPADILKVVPADSGLNVSASDIVFLNRLSALLTSSIIFWATAVGTIPLEVLVNRSSSNVSLSLERALLTAGCVIPNTSPALVRLRSV